MGALKRRIPVRLRHHWRVVAAAAAFFAVLVGVAGTTRVAPIVTSDERAEAAEVTFDVAGRTDLFDTTREHTVSLSFAADDYNRMLDQYFADGSKEYLKADVVVDGTPIEDVGIRLKGNSTLGSLTRNGQRAPGGFGGGRRIERPEGGEPPRGGVFIGGPGGASALRAEEPEKLPWLISFDEFVDGRRYQGRSEIAVRPAAGMASSTGLNEATALALAALGGDPGQRFTYSAFTVNDRPTVSRLLVEHPDQEYADDLPGDGVLYKSLARGAFADQGDDQTAYQDDFKQVNRKGSQDLEPVIELIRWLDGASDEEFAAGLADRVDVGSLARYAALQNLLLNFDDMAGPGRNYYLYYDLDAHRFSVLTWDLNLALNGDPAQGSRESGGFGGFRRGGAEEQPPGGRRQGGGFGGGHPLKDRFLDSAAFAEAYEDAYRDLYQKLYASGAATRTVDQVAAMAKRSGADASTIDADAESLRALLDERRAALAQDEIVRG